MKHSPAQHTPHPPAKLREIVEVDRVSPVGGRFAAALGVLQEGLHEVRAGLAVQGGVGVGDLPAPVEFLPGLVPAGLVVFGFDKPLGRCTFDDGGVPPAVLLAVPGF